MNILIARTDKIGDLILSLPAIYKVRQMFPNAFISLLVRNYNCDIVKNLSYIDDILTIDSFSQEELIEKLRALNLDFFVSLYSNKKIAEIARKSKAKYRIGAYLKLYSFFSYNKGLWQNRKKALKHEAEYNLDLIRKMDKKLFDKSKMIEAKLPIEEKHHRFAQEILKFSKNKIIVIHPFNGGSAQNLTIKQYELLIEKILTQSNFDILIIGHISDEKTMCDNFKFSSNRVKKYLNDKSILYIAAIMDKADLFVGSSTGTLHLAGILNKEVVAFFPRKPAQSKERWRAYSDAKAVYFEGAPYSKKKDKKNQNCFENLNMEDVANTITTFWPITK